MFKIYNFIIVLVILFTTSCALNSKENNTISLDHKSKIVSGQRLLVKYDNNMQFNFLEVKLLDENNVIETYGKKDIRLESGEYIINRFLRTDLSLSNRYFLRFVFTNDVETQVYENPIRIERSVIIKSFCSKNVLFSKFYKFIVNLILKG